jgi:broad specificity phosphatase PhoE
VAARWLLVRHGKATGTVPGAYFGWTDVPLDESARPGLRHLASRLARQDLALACSSDLRRARQTLALLLEGREPAPPTRAEAALRELHFGVWEGLSYAEIAARPDGPDVLAGGRAAPGGESLADLAARVERFLDGLRRETPDEAEGAVLIVAHGGPLRVLLCLLLGLAPQAHWRFRLDHGSLSEVRWDAATGAVLCGLNSRDHHLLPEGEGR